MSSARCTFSPTGDSAPEVAGISDGPSRTPRSSSSSSSSVVRGDYRQHAERQCEIHTARISNSTASSSSTSSSEGARSRTATAFSSGAISQKTGEADCQFIARPAISEAAAGITRIRQFGADLARAGSCSSTSSCFKIFAAHSSPTTESNRIKPHTKNTWSCCTTRRKEPRTTAMSFSEAHAARPAAMTQQHGRFSFKMKSSLARLFCVYTSFFSLLTHAFDEQDPCRHHDYPDMGVENPLKDGQFVHAQIVANKTHRYSFQTMNTTLIHVPDQFRKLIINLEPCKGIVYLFVRKTRPCYPDPYSCMKFGPTVAGSSQETVPQADECEWTHYVSVIDGTRDGAPTFFELPLTSTRYYIAVYAKETSSYTLTVLTDIGAWPRPGNEGQLQATQLQELQVQIGWDTAYYRPTGVSETLQYYVWSAMLLERDQRTNAAVFLTKRKIMNTVCGLTNNTDRPATPTPIPASRCSGGKCNATIDGVVTGKRYVFNVVAESKRGYNMSYAGLILRTDWSVERRAASQQTLMAVGGLTGSIFAMVIVIYCWMISLYGK